MRFFSDRYKHLRVNHEIRELIFCPLFTLDSQRQFSEQLVGSVLQLMPTFANLEKVMIANQCLHSWHQHRQLISNLSERFQFPSVCELHFATTAETWNKIWSWVVKINVLVKNAISDTKAVSIHFLTNLNECSLTSTHLLYRISRSFLTNGNAQKLTQLRCLACEN